MTADIIFLYGVMVSKRMYDSPAHIMRGHSWELCVEGLCTVMVLRWCSSAILTVCLRAERYDCPLQTAACQRIQLDSVCMLP
jgi:hypothetical protein